MHGRMANGCVGLRLLSPRFGNPGNCTRRRRQIGNRSPLRDRPHPQCCWNRIRCSGAAIETARMIGLACHVKKSPGGTAQPRDSQWLGPVTGLYQVAGASSRRLLTDC
jgi:hypothetical protein